MRRFLSHVGRPWLAVLLAAGFGLAGCRTVAPDGSRTGVRLARGPAVAADPVRSLVFVEVTAQGHRFQQPWDTTPPARRRGLGVVLEGGRVLVPAALIADSTFVGLERPTDRRRAPARVVARDYECNLALLETEDADFLADAVPLALDGPALAGTAIDVWQVDDDGSPVVTEGRLVQVTLGRYALPGYRFLRYAFEGSIQPRGDGYVMPGVREGRLTGLLYGYQAQRRTGAMIPAPIIRRFLDTVEAGPYVGFPRLDVRTERTSDEQFRLYLGLPEDVGGAYVARVHPGGAAYAAGLREGDTILSIGGYAIDRRGYYADPDFGLLNFGHLVSGRHRAGDTLEVEFWRDGAVETIDLTLAHTPPEAMPVDPYLFDRGPRFVVHGGLVFTELTRPYLNEFPGAGDRNAPLLLRYAAAYPEEFAEGREKIVILSAVIPTPASLGYEAIRHAPVEEANGKAIGSIRDLAAALEEPRGGIHEIRVRGPWPPLVLDAALAEQVNAQLERQGLSPLSRVE